MDLLKSRHRRLGSEQTLLYDTELGRPPVYGPDVRALVQDESTGLRLCAGRQDQNGICCVDGGRSCSSVIFTVTVTSIW